ncbi:MAG: hypothetical protein AB7D57_04010 [Desulfovibrionaceae bacterium]
MPTLSTPYGVLSVSGPVSRRADGTLCSCTPAAGHILDTPLGPLAPEYDIDDIRRRDVQPLCFHANGRLRTVPLQHAVEVDTPAGPMSAELVTFHPNGALSRVFPLNGRLSAYWSQEDEAGLAQAMTVRTPLGPVTAKCIAVAFYDTGALRSLTLWPEEVVEVVTPLGPLPVRHGLSFFPDGALRGLEPGRMVPVPTLVGEVAAWDPDAVGVSGEMASLRFSPAGEVRRVVSVHTCLEVCDQRGGAMCFAPDVRESLCGDGDLEPVPMSLEFLAGGVRVRRGVSGPAAVIPWEGRCFSTRPHIPAMPVQLERLGCRV